MLIIATIFLIVGFFLIYSAWRNPSAPIMWTGRAMVFISGMLFGGAMGW